MRYAVMLHVLACINNPDNIAFLRVVRNRVLRHHNIGTPNPNSEEAAYDDDSGISSYEDFYGSGDDSGSSYEDFYGSGSDSDSSYGDFYDSGSDSGGDWGGGGDW